MQRISFFSYLLAIACLVVGATPGRAMAEDEAQGLPVDAPVGDTLEPSAVEPQVEESKAPEPSIVEKAKPSPAPVAAKKKSKKSKKSKKKGSAKKKKAHVSNKLGTTRPLSAFELGRYQYCGDDRDCVVVNNGCCDCGNGGQDVAINRERQKAFEARFDCMHVSCGGKEVFPLCGSGVVSCLNHKCNYFSETPEAR